jgi:hypothetical protein
MLLAIGHLTAGYSAGLLSSVETIFGWNGAGYSTIWLLAIQQVFSVRWKRFGWNGAGFSAM